MKNIDLRPPRRPTKGSIETRYPVRFTENGVVEDEELFLVNVRPPKTQGRFARNTWDTVHF